MKTQVEEELKALALEILTFKDEDVNQLKLKAAALYERLSVLNYLEDSKETIENTSVEEPLMSLESPKKIGETEEFSTIIEVNQFLDELIEETPEEVIEKPKVKIEASNLLDELEELTAGFDLPEFERKEPQDDSIPVTINTTQHPKSSLNDTLKKTIQIGLNDRLAFVKNLFDGNQDDFTRVLSQLNTLDSKAGARNFIAQMVKPEYKNWEGKEAFEERFIEIVFRKFDGL